MTTKPESNDYSYPPTAMSDTRLDPMNSQNSYYGDQSYAKSSAEMETGLTAQPPPQDPYDEYDEREPWCECDRCCDCCDCGRCGAASPYDGCVGIFQFLGSCLCCCFLCGNC
ncbi:hypothetical protein CPB86DRAFT_414553 [Serendipita vermifera]|nr:hypothetical protein CPB86DRAFT_414553 [Serendipita vermifera]